MDKGKRKILVLVEGAKTDLRLMKHLLHIYGIDNNHQVVSYNTNIYTLYNTMFRDSEPADLDILQHLKEHEPDPNKKVLFDERYSDILLVFDLDPHDAQFSEEKIQKMMAFFVESSDMGKLYLNYPMVEAFYHMKSIPDPNYDGYIVALDELKAGKYKARVHTENRNHDYTKFAVNKDECNMVIRQNIDKAWLISKTPDRMSPLLPDLLSVLSKQLEKIQADNSIAILCTCAFYIVDYNPSLVENI